MTTKSSLPGERSVQLDIRIMGREYKVACKEGERAELLEALSEDDDAVFLEAVRPLPCERLHRAEVAAGDLGDDGTVPGIGRTDAVVDDEIDPPVFVDGVEARRRIIAMQAAIDQTMAGQEKLL